MVALRGMTPIGAREDIPESVLGHAFFLFCAEFQFQTKTDISLKVGRLTIRSSIHSVVHSYRVKRKVSTHAMVQCIGYVINKPDLHKPVCQ